MSWAKTAKSGDRIVSLKTGKFLVKGKVYVVEDILPPIGKDFGVLVLGLRGNRKGKHKSGAFQAYCFRPPRYPADGHYSLYETFAKGASMTQLSDYQLRREKLFAALESGKYKKAVAELEAGQDCFCLVGLAYFLETGKQPYQNKDISGVYYQVVDLYGLVDEAVFYRLNDQTNLPFPEMAKYIRNNPREFFIPGTFS